jgi:hypothetical protein
MTLSSETFVEGVLRCGVVVMLWPRYREMFGSNLGRNTGCPDLSFHGFPQFPLGKSIIFPQSGNEPILSNS